MKASVDISEIRAILSLLPEIEKKSEVEYCNSESFPWFSLSLIYTENPDGWSTNRDNPPSKINLVSIIARKEEDKNLREIYFMKYKELFSEIARNLNWEFIDECTDDELEDYIIWSPKL